MFVIIDWVANHTAWDHKWITEHPEYYTKDSLGKIIAPVPDWTDVADLNFDNKNLWIEMIDALKFWVEEFNIDGYRCDVAGMIPIEFWLQTRNELEKIKNVFMLAEWDTPEMHTVFDMSYDWNAHKLMNRIAKGEKNVRDLRDHLNNNKNQFPPNAFRMHFTSNHDENSWNGTEFERLDDAAETFAVLTFIIPGMPLIYSGQESGLNERLKFFEKDTINWSDHPFKNLYTRMIDLKKKNQSLFNGTMGSELIEINSTNPDHIFTFTRGLKKDKVLAVFNLSNDELTFDLNGENLSGSYKDYFTGEPATYSDKENFLLREWEYKIFISYVEP
jgi:glycosidase